MTLLILLLPVLWCWNCMPDLYDAEGWAQDFLCARQVLYQWSCISTLMKLTFSSHSQWVTLEDFWKSLLSILSAYNEWPSGIHWMFRMTLSLYYWALQVVSFFSPSHHMWALLGLFYRWIKYMFTYASCKEKSGPSDGYRVSIPWLLLCLIYIKTEVGVTSTLYSSHHLLLGRAIPFLLRSFRLSPLHFH